MSYEYSEDQLIEQATEDVLKELGWTVITAWQNETFGESGLLGRDNKTEVVFERSLRKALQKYNPELPDLAYTRAIEKIVQKEAGKTISQENKAKYLLLKNGVEVTFTNEEGKAIKKTLKIFDYQNYNNNEFLAVRQLEITGELHNRRPDVIGFINGIPLVFFELKAHANDLRSAYDDNLKDYKDTIPHLFYHNAFVILSNGTDAKVGTVTSPYKYFLDWKRITEDAEGIVSLDTMLRGVCSPQNLMDIFENFLLFDESNGNIVKLMAKNHQFIGVNRVLDNVENIEDLEGKLGVYWHTQGSGKTYSMVFLCEKIHRKFGGSYTFLIVVDRTELENQAYDTFSGVGIVKNKNVIAGKKNGITGRDNLRELLSENHRYVFSLIHKFSIDPEKETEYPLITERKNIIVISDEAHRTQGGKYARNMRFFGLPNASYLGFTGTPIIKDEEEVTKNIFGEYVSVYDFKRAIEDEATLPLKYLNRGERLNIENPALNDQMAEILEEEDLDEDQKKKLAYLFKKEYPILTSEHRLRAIAKDLVWHFNERGYQGKAMFVALDKPTAVRMYDYVMEYLPEYLTDLENQIKKSKDIQEEQELRRKYNLVDSTEVCVVISSEQNEIDKFRKMNLDIEPHRRRMVERNLEKEFKDEDNPFRLAIVCAMWITGFDAPTVSTVYLDKPIKGHTLMQTIARANRVYDDEKENGLIVDYGNVYQQLEKAYSVYGEGSKGAGSGNGGDDKKPFEQLESISTEIKEAIEEVVLMLKDLDFDIKTLIDAAPMGKIAAVNNGANAVCRNDETRAKFEIAARNVFRKYKTLFPEKQAKKFTKQYNAIDAIYNKLNQKIKSADVTEIISKLQSVVNNSVVIDNITAEPKNIEIDLSKLNFEELRKAFEKVQRKNEIVYDLNKAVEQKLEQMLKENPLRMDFYERYQEIVEAYNNGKSEVELKRSFDNLTAFVATLSQEEKRAYTENLDQPTLSIFDLLIQNKDLTKAEREEVKNVAQKTLETLQKEKLNIPNWKESRELKAGVKTAIYDQLLWLPEQKYTDEEVSLKSIAVYQHVYSYTFL
ncbi:type I restriction endonuclease subunit R [Chryseobacterium sp. Ch-15]|uniref:Type I restriction enzyme endonuclease subunit n=1 Tax=Chryseobacterium muglaense TaxID=2893752 RepID=A0A9Q3YUT5_9FLAO|nr:type I restriction endonuclease subunit R [Chryseobacterium muglaense]MBD3906510.1 type I restriction endonuclease subunit R [Chryseobacterium muglaense]MCC9034015.1 type I restriction endonuclease subunit R [Chryseobacterium muglaense]MCM2556218.1 type I restriction endonuclease subunit R [Chryseobacterium muglaense]